MNVDPKSPIEKLHDGGTRRPALPPSAVRVELKGASADDGFTTKAEEMAVLLATSCLENGMLSSGSGAVVVTSSNSSDEAL